MLSPPELPGGGMRRETTSFGVYSNLAAHSRRELTKVEETRRVEPLPVVTSGLQYKLIQAIKKSDIEEVQQIFSSYPDLKLQFVDENDRTVLHHCFDMQKRRVNYDILKILLDRNPSIINYCKNEAPVLHNAVRLGHALSVHLLVKHGADVNIQYKRTFRTALHEAVVNGRKVSAEILLSNGANTTVIEKDGRLACDLCKENTFQREDFDAIEECVANKRLEIHEVSETTSGQFNNVGVSAQLSSANSDMVMLVKRQSLETSKVNFSLLEEEDIASDVFTCRVLQNPEGASARFSLPLFDKSFSSREEIIVKTGSGQEITPSEMQTGKHGLVVVFDTALKECDTFVCVCRPKVENWQVGKGQTVLGSVIDNQVRIHINKNSFNTKTSLSLQVIELPEDVDIKEDTILASTPFYKINADQKVEKDITIELPKPTCYDVDGQCIVLAKSGPQWGIVDMQADEKRNTVSFTEHQLPVISTVAVIKPESSAETLAHEINETLKLVSNIKYRVCFLCLTKRVENARKFTVVVECCEVKVLDARRRYWKGQGYKEQQEKDLLAQIGVQSKQAFKLVFYDSAILRKDPRFVDLEFHRKRDNIVRFTVELKGKTIQFINGRLYVYAAQAGSDNKAEVVGKEPLASVDINLVLNQIEIGISSSDSGSDIRSDSTRSVKSLNVSSQSDDRPISRAAERRHSARASGARPGSRSGSRDAQMKQSEPDSQIDALKKVQASLARAMKNIDPVPEEEIPPVETTEKETEMPSPENDTSDEFLGDILLDTLIEELSDDWYKIYVLSGMAFSEIEEAILQTKQTTLVKKQLFRRWRNLHQNREDIGLPFLLGALYKGGCRNIATTVQIKLKTWYSKSVESDFQKWVAKAYSDSDLFVPSDYPKPMSDSYLVLMSDELPPTRDLARALHITDTASDDILENPDYLLDGIKVMKLLTLFRDRTPRSIDALEKLIACIGDLGFDKLRNYAIKCSKAWLKRTATRKDDPFRYQVDALLSKFQ
ncbi:uncharacterized protein LOC123528900 [Mercenaria mercenaria]|uniref:uncharacterized protein LOC123528900 n=1 Tax=Mercenaria mercenaria TaxID=6596 RepID=UPI00234EDD6B|nr:uncharacterized protein LOC123528900 [Mercenaria mercenaria]